MHASQRVEEDNRDPVSALFDSLKETERQQAFLRQQLKAALQDKMRAATAKIQAAQKEQSDLETVWGELFGEEECVLDDEVQAPTDVPAVVEEDVVQEEDRKKVEASTWRWFEGAVEGDEGVSRTLRGGLPNESSHLLPSYKSTPPVKMTRFMEEAEPIDQESDSRLALSTSLSASLGSLASSAAINTVQLPASHYDSILKSSYREPPYRMVASERVDVPTGMVAVRRESLITLLRAFDQILLHEAA
ncbi:1409_t:CDS:2 [Acaulospora colombiana]|uniref:1409_t:CDS:1 n=1 Tax=Acaulospora colombiana TaxID=27376 RepID=A0ACA9P873_9GLOM|nr:1409_t:CDS:2 [Acaulospora colombiana]